MHSQLNKIKYPSSFEAEKVNIRHTANKSHQSKTILCTLLVCPICTDKIKNSHMCPHCSKLFCQNCIKNWVVTKKPECPNCSRSLRLTLIVNCSQLGKQLQQAINIMNMEGEQNKDFVFEDPETALQENKSSTQIGESRQNNELLCKQHEIKLQYYCETCLKGICSDCAVLTETHRYHKLCKLSQKRLSFLQEVEKTLKRVEGHRQTLLRGKEEGLQSIEKVKLNQNNQLSQLQICIKKLIDEASKKSSTIVETKQTTCNSTFHHNIEQAAAYDRLLNSLKISTKSALIRNFATMEQEIAVFLKPQQRDKNHNEIDIENQITPKYEQKVFILDNYTHMKQKKDILYSEAFFWRGIQWRLKIYPGGLEDDSNKKDLDQYLAIYLEMSKGLKEHLNTYKYKIELINQEDRSKKISRVFESEFEEGLCWGYDTFAKITTLYEQKYVHPQQDYLQMVLCVKSPTYYHAVSDQNFMIGSKAKVLEEKLQKIKELRKKVGHKNVMNEKSNKSSRTVQALVDECEGEKGSIKRIKSNNDISKKKQL